MKKHWIMFLSLCAILLLFTFINLASTAFQNPGGGIIMYDNAEQIPETDWDINHTKGYAMVTGGNQSTTNVDPRTGFRVSTNYARSGSKSYEVFVTKRTDYPPCCEWTRSEVMWMSPSQQIIANEWRFAGVSILIDPSWQFEARRVQLAFDHKENPDDLETPFWLGIQNDRYILDGRFVEGITDLGVVEKGVWVDWLLERNWSTGTDGYMRFYKNGVKVWERLGPNKDGRSGSAPITRIQHGLYKWVWASANGEGEGPGTEPQASAPIKIYMDEIRFGGPTATLSQFLLNGSGVNPPVIPGWTYCASEGGVCNFTDTREVRYGDIGGNWVYKNLTGPVSCTASTFQDPLPVPTKLCYYSDTLPVVVNTPPTVNTGNDQSITLPTSSVTITGTASDTDGTISTYSWTKTAGGTATIVSPSLPSTNVTGLSAGNYTFTVTVTDNGGLIATDSVNITVNAPVSKFITGERVQVNTSSIKVRATASTSARSLGTQYKNALGTVIGGPLISGGYTWWNINYDSGADGWSTEEYLNKFVNKFKTGDKVQVNTTSIKVRSTASLSGKSTGTQYKNALGTVVGGPTPSDGYIWWKVDFSSGADGWSTEEYLSKIIVN